MSNLRHMRDTQAERRVLLLYSNKTESDIVFREELARMEEEAGRGPELQVVHVLSRPGEAWSGEKGHLDREKLARLCGRTPGDGLLLSLLSAGADPQA